MNDKDKRYITICFGNDFIRKCKGEIPTEIFDATDIGFYGIIDITDPDHPIRYRDGKWISVDEFLGFEDDPLV